MMTMGVYGEIERDEAEDIPQGPSTSTKKLWRCQQDSMFLIGRDSFVVARLGNQSEPNSGICLGTKIARAAVKENRHDERMRGKRRAEGECSMQWAA